MVIAITLIVAGAILLIFPNTVATIIAGTILLVAPLYNIFTSYNKKEIFKKELIKLILGVILILCGVGSIVKVFLYIIGGLAILLSLLYMIYNIIIYIKINKAYKKNKQENDVIDV